MTSAYIPEGGRAVDCAVGDIHHYAVLQLALAVARWIGEQAPAVGEA